MEPLSPGVCEKLPAAPHRHGTRLLLTCREAGSCPASGMGTLVTLSLSRDGFPRRVDEHGKRDVEADDLCLQGEEFPGKYPRPAAGVEDSLPRPGRSSSRMSSFHISGPPSPPGSRTSGRTVPASRRTVVSWTCLTSRPTFFPCPLPGTDRRPSASQGSPGAEC